MHAPLPAPRGVRSTAYTAAEIRAIRAIALVAAIAYPVFWWIHRMGGTAWLDPFPLRLLVSVYALGLVAASYRPATADRLLYPMALGLVHGVILHFFVLLTLNDLHWEFVLGVLLVIIGLSAGSSLGFRTRRSLHVYLAVLLVGTAASALLVDDPVVPIPYYLTAMAVATLTSYFGIGAHLGAREEVLAGRRRLEAVLTGAPVALWSTDERGRIEAIDGRGLDRLGLAPGEIRGRSVDAAFGEASPLAEAVRHASDGNAFAVTLEHQQAVFETWHAPLRDGNGRIVGTVGVATDVSEIHRMSRSLRQSQKMEAIGRLAGGIAHDFNNILTAVLGYAQIARAEVDEGGPVADALDEIRSASERAAGLVRQLLAFSRRQPLEPRRVDLHELVCSMTSMLQPLLGKDLLLETRLDPSTPAIEVDPTGIEQILMNLAVNARDACPDGGTLVVATRGETLVRDRGGLAPGRYAVLEVTDDGEGMEDEVRERIFDPFFTTKPFGRGSGMGLATVYGIVEQTGGGIEVVSAPGEGSTFTIRLPAAGDPGEGSDPAPG